MPAMLGEALAFGAAAAWGGAAILYKREALKVDALTMNFLASLGASAFLLSMLVATGKTHLLMHVSAVGLVYTVLTLVVGIGIGDTFYLLAIRFMRAGEAVLVSSIYPLFTLLFAPYLLLEFVSGRLVMGAVLIVLGVWAVSLRGLRMHRRRARFNTGFGCAVVAALCWGFSLVLFKVAFIHIDPLVFSTLRVGLLSLVLLPIVISRLSSLGTASWLWLCAAGLVERGLGLVLISYAYVYTDVSRATPISSIYPLITVALARVALGEKITPHMLVGALLVVAGLYVIV